MLSFMSATSPRNSLFKLFGVLWLYSWPPLPVALWVLLLVRRSLFFSIITLKLHHSSQKSWNLGSSLGWEGKFCKTRGMILKCVTEKRQVDVLAVPPGWCQGEGLGIPLTKPHSSWVSISGRALLSMGVHSELFPDCPAWQSDAE